MNYKDLSDQELCFFLAKGDSGAFNEIYRRYWLEVLNAGFKRLKSKAEAEEIVQEVFVNLFIRRADISSESSLIAYLKTAVKFKVFDYYRAREVRQSYLVGLGQRESGVAVLPDEQLELKQLREKILLTADKLPEKCREVFVMSRFEHLSQQEIADRLDISLSTVKKHMNKAINVMRKEFKGQPFELIAVCFYVFLNR